MWVSLVTGSPMCSAFSQLQKMNKGRMTEQAYNKMVSDALANAHSVVQPPVLGGVAMNPLNHSVLGMETRQTYICVMYAATWDMTTHGYDDNNKQVQHRRWIKQIQTFCKS